MKSVISFILAIGLVGVGVSSLYAHCEIPCGIYDDQARVQLLHEHVDTLEKSMTKIKELSAAGEKNYNQLIRWVNNKDQHATEIQEIIGQYFLTQRIKYKDGSDPAAHIKYYYELSRLHKMMVHAMKAKQTLDATHTKALRELLKEFNDSYFGQHEHKGSTTDDMKAPQ